MVSFGDEVNAVELIPDPTIIVPETTSESLARLSNLLKDDNETRIGVCGMGGVGKTTLVRNLNNQLALERVFTIVIWVTVSRNTSLRRIQSQIMERLNINLNMEESDERVLILLNERLQNMRRFLLILDDVWETVKLNAIGIPGPEQCPGSKTIITTRSFDVCRQMNVGCVVEVRALKDEEAWELFYEKAGDVVMKEDIRPVAEMVAKECGGLPLAITAVGASMKDKPSTALWEDALRALQKSEAHGKGTEDKVFKTIKWSYDSLGSKNHKLCLLLCCLYPKDYDISVFELVRYWFCENLLDLRLSYEESKNKGPDIIQSLKDSYLLEDGIDSRNIKMHDVVRDACTWIASSIEDDYRSLIRSGIGLTCITEDELSTSSYKRISFMRNQIMELPNDGFKCSEASILLLNTNKNLETIPASFIEGFEALKILDLSQTAIKCLPSLQKLSQLRALILRGCSQLTELPHLDFVIRLLILDCSESAIAELPSRLEKPSSHHFPFHGFPMLFTRIRKISADYTNDMCNIRSCANHNIH